MKIMFIEINKMNNQSLNRKETMTYEVRNPKSDLVQDSDIWISNTVIQTIKITCTETVILNKTTHYHSININIQ